MQQRLSEVTGVIEQAEAALRSAYEPEQLYALRVAMRRLRSMLKPIENTRARRFRKAWGGFAAVTNRARDWDVFIAAAGALLSGEQFEAFEQHNRDAIQAAHDAVLELLDSAHWRRHLRDWRQYVEQSAPAPDEADLTAAAVAQALTRARAALAAALEAGDERAWHKLRIAVKEVRYQAECASAETPVDPDQEPLVDLCKPLQSLLGGWHDSVVQLQLIEEEGPMPGQEALRDAIERRRAEGLAEIQRTVADHPLFVPSGETLTRTRSSSVSGS